MDRHPDDAEINVYALTLLQFFSHDGNDVDLSAVIDSGAILRIIELVSNSAHDAVVHAGLKVLGNCLSGGDMLAQQVIGMGCLQALATGLHSPEKWDFG